MHDDKLLKGKSQEGLVLLRHEISSSLHITTNTFRESDSVPWERRGVIVPKLLLHSNQCIMLQACPKAFSSTHSVMEEQEHRMVPCYGHEVESAVVGANLQEC